MLDETTYHPNPSVAERDVRSARKRIFCKEDEYWTIGYGANVFRLKDSKGLAYLACLLRLVTACLWCATSRQRARRCAPTDYLLYQSSRLHPSSQHSFHQ